MDREREAGGRAMLSGLLATSHLTPIEQLPGNAAREAAAAGFTEVLIYLVDLQGQTMHLLAGERAPSGEEHETQLQIEGTVPGRAFQHGQISAPGAEPGQWWVPLLDGTERLGVLRVTSVHDDERAQEDMRRLAALLALTITGYRSSSDALAKLVRAEPLNIAAEMQWAIMPPRTYADGRVVISASLEPAHRISGDVFEYAVDGPLVHLTILDAMGHDTAAGLCGVLALSACRNARRSGADLIAKANAIESALNDQYGHTRYATGVLATLDTRTGALHWLNRGHLPPVIIRGNRWTSRLDCPPAHPMGADLDVASTVCHEQLEPGDRIVLYTDGITEARRRGGAEFGLDRFTDFLIRHHADGLSVPETLRRLTHAILDYHDGRLQDDATVLLCEWLGPGPHHHPTPRARESTQP